MLFAAAVGLALALFLLFRSRKTDAPRAAHDSTPVLDAWLSEALELELAGGALGLRSSTTEERRKLAETLANDPDADVVGRIEESVASVELEFVRYAHEAKTKVTVRVRYTNGKVGARHHELGADELPKSVAAEMSSHGTTHVFRTWTFPWQRAASL